MTSDGIAEAVQRRALEAGIGDVHVHQLRHSAAHYLRLAGADDDAVLRLMGWKDRSIGSGHVPTSERPGVATVPILGR